jgi:predicted transcriptional regulator
MRQENLQYFTEKEEEFIDILTEIGMKKNSAKVLVFLANKPESTSREIDCGTDLRQPEISHATKYLMAHGYITSGKSSSKKKGRQRIAYQLAKPVTEILDCIEIEKKKEATDQLAVIDELRNYIR